MEMRPPYFFHVNIIVSVKPFGETYDSVVLAADRVGAARVSSNTDDGERRAAQTDESGEIGENDTEQAKDCRDRIRASLKRQLSLGSISGMGSWKLTV